MAQRLSGAPARCDSKYAGTPTGYRKHMEQRKLDGEHVPCLACREAIRRAHLRYRNRRIMNGARANKGSGYKLRGGTFWQDSTGSRRRLQALGVIGYGWNDLGRRLGHSGNSLGVIARNPNVKIYPETVEKIKRLYDELSMLPPEETRTVKIAKTRLRRNGWVPPLAWDDDTIDDPYALPSGMTQVATWNWYCNAALIHERIEWVLVNGFPKNPNVKK